MKRKQILLRQVGDIWSPFFDIVNGFLNRCRGGIVVKVRAFGAAICAIDIITNNQIDYLAEISSALSSSDRLLCRPVVDGVDSQA
ncbi:hypothetical protein [Parerythrobacter lacustris]|uniref:Uncharacterized protein n=1 Tax=Parerythrobacter lacustris TaxID=2969984 RepID=A0ABT1XUU7_9SPHN|nr:hypothetical protein [Parerythrobacter lacustris]MCR2834691.1 hypothetical protein [Parerythrobacter lacustris]